MYRYLCKKNKKLKFMKKAFFILAFVLVGMMSCTAQEIVTIDSIQVGDNLIFTKKCDGVMDASGDVWVYQPSSYIVNDVSIFNGVVSYVEIINNKGEVTQLYADMLQYFEKKNKVHVCR